MNNSTTGSPSSIEAMKNLYIFGCEKVIADDTIPTDQVHLVENSKGELVEIRATTENIKRLRKGMIKALNKKRETAVLRFGNHQYDEE